LICRLFGKTRQAYYKRKKETYKESINEDLVLTVVKKIRETQKRTGGRKLLEMVREKVEQEQLMGRDAFFNLLRSHGLHVRKRRFRAVTTNSFHWLHKYPNLIKSLSPERPNHIWVSDITYINTGNGFLYLYLITDAYSRKIIGWHLSDNLGSDNAILALFMAISQLPANCGEIIHHSDRGIQYCSLKYVKILEAHGIKISMTENGDPYENAIAERVNGILKTEWLYDMNLHNHIEAREAIEQIIRIYNTERLHSSIEMLTPDQAHSCTGKLKRLWKSYKKSIRNNPKKITEMQTNTENKITESNFVNLYQY
jgi:transposase InsO family protein